MDEETDDSLGNELPEELRYEQKVVVVYPDKVAWLVDFCYAFGIDSIGLLIFAPVLVNAGSFGCDVLPEEIMEERP